MKSELLHDIAGFFLILSSILLTMGIIRPLLVLWWTQHKTRTKVLMVYGSVALISAVLFFITINPSEDSFKDGSRTDGDSKIRPKSI